MSTNSNPEKKANCAHKTEHTSFVWF